MNPLKTIETLIDDPAALLAAERPAGLGRTGLLGYLAGTAAFFLFLRLFSAVPPGVMSFGVVFAFVLGFNFFFAGVMHLFLDLTGARGRAGRLFLVFGCSDLLLSLLVPAAFFAKLGYVNAFLALCLCLLLVIYARVRLVRRLYDVSSNKALLAVWLPYLGLSTAMFLAFVYSIAWLVWLVI